MLDRITSMRIFVDAVSQGSISAAARLSSMTPAMAARHIDALEERLGVRLLHRSTRKLVITEIGKQYLASCRLILDDIDDMESDISARHSDISGTVKLNAPLSFGSRYIAPLIPQLIQRHPHLSVDMDLTDSQHDLSNRDWDITIRVGYLADSQLRSRKLGDCSLHVCASPGYWERYGIPSRLQDLTQHNCLSYTLSPTQSGGHWTFGKNGELEVPVSGSFSANNGDALVAAATQGMGVIYQPDFIVKPSLDSGSLVAMTHKDIPTTVGGVHVMFTDNRKLPARVRATIDFFAEVFSDAY